MEKETFYITTPIYYPSGKLHIGILPQRQFNAPANIAITNNTYRNFCVHFG